MSKEEKIRRAKDIVLSCPRCKSPTDHDLDEQSKVWLAICECGKRARYDDKFVQSEIKQIVSETDAK